MTFMLANLISGGIKSSASAVKWNAFIITQNDENLRVIFGNMVGEAKIHDAHLLHMVGPKASMQNIGSVTLVSGDTYKIFDQNGNTVPNMSLIPFEIITLLPTDKQALTNVLKNGTWLACFRFIQSKLLKSRNFEVKDDLIISNDRYCTIPVC